MATTNNKTRKILLEFGIAGETINEVRTYMRALVEQYKALELSSADANTSALRYAASLDSMTDSLRAHLNAETRQAREIKDTANAVDDATRKVRDYGDEWRRASDSVDAFGDVDTSVAALSGLARGVGLGGVADVGMLGSDVFASVEALGRLPTALRGAGTQAQSAIQSMTGLEVGLGTLGAVAGGAVVAVGLVIGALELWKRANEETVEAVRSWISGTQEANALLRGGLTTEDATSQIDQWNQEIADNAERIELLRGSYGQVTDGLGVLTHLADAFDVRGIQEMRTEWEQLEARNQELNIAIGELRNQRGQEIIATNEATNAERELTEAKEAAAQAGREAAAANREQAKAEQLAAAEEAAQAEVDRLQSMADIARQYEADYTATVQAANEQRLALEERYADKQVSIAEAAAESAEKALQKLIDKQNDLARDYSRGEADALDDYRRDRLSAQVDYQRQEARAARDHATRMADIRKSQQESEFEAILNSDFRSLYMSRRRTNTALEEETQSYLYDRADRLSEYQQAQQDAANQYAIERQQRLEDYQQKLNDAREAYEQERKDIEANKKKQLQTLQQSYNNELATLRTATQNRLQLLASGAQQELTLASMTEQQRLKLQQQANQQYLALAQQLMNGMVAISSKASQYAAQMTSYSSVSYKVSAPATYNITSGANAANVAALVDQRVTTSLSKLVGGTSK